jgi:hypothetical protein
MKMTEAIINSMTAGRAPQPDISMPAAGGALRAARARSAGCQPADQAVPRGAEDVQNHSKNRRARIAPLVRLAWWAWGGFAPFRVPSPSRFIRLADFRKNNSIHIAISRRKISMVRIRLRRVGLKTSLATALLPRIKNLPVMAASSRFWVSTTRAPIPRRCRLKKTACSTG